MNKGTPLKKLMKEPGRGWNVYFSFQFKDEKTQHLKPEIICHEQKGLGHEDHGLPNSFMDDRGDMLGL